MQKIQIGQSDLMTSQFTLGCMSLQKDQFNNNELIRQAIDIGINHLDTADLYDFGQNEVIVGTAIKDIREQIILTSKVGNVYDKAQDKIIWNPSKNHIISSLKDSLHRLQTDYLDMYLLHGGTIDDDHAESIAAFESLKQEGLIRAYGISSIRPNVIRRFVEDSNMDAVMLQYNLLDQRAEETIFPLLKEHGIGILTRGPIAKGLLTKNWAHTLTEKFPDGYLDFGQNELKSSLDKMQKLLPNRDFIEIAYQFLLASGYPTSIVFGPRTIEQLTETIHAIDRTSLTQNEYSILKELFPSGFYTNHR